jgi:pimeloyl-ACP methyl ester carboxylesterase
VRCAPTRDFSFVCAAGIRHRPPSDRFEALDVPTLFLLGGDSPDPFKAAGEAVQEALPDCRVVVMPGQRHAAMDTGTELFTVEVLSFLEAS